jgi:hypothetical protein
MLDDIRVVGERRCHMATQQRGDRRDVARIRHEIQVDLGQTLEQFERHVLRGRWAEARERHFAGLGACRIEKLGKRAIGRRAADHDEHRSNGKMTDWLETG